jgi:hypothetical protein
LCCDRADEPHPAKATAHAATAIKRRLMASGTTPTCRKG